MNLAAQYNRSRAYNVKSGKSANKKIVLYLEGVNRKIYRFIYTLAACCDTFLTYQRPKKT